MRCSTFAGCAKAYTKSSASECQFIFNKLGLTYRQAYVAHVPSVLPHILSLL